MMAIRSRAEVPVTVAFAPKQSPAIVKEIVGAITAARSRLLAASVVVSSGRILALSEAIDRGISLGGVYDGPQMDQVKRQWVTAHVGDDKINILGKGILRLSRKTRFHMIVNKPRPTAQFYAQQACYC